jgi:hypothetical protein
MAGAHGSGQRPATLAAIREMVGDPGAAELEAIFAKGRGASWADRAGVGLVGRGE